MTIDRGSIRVLWPRRIIGMWWRWLIHLVPLSVVVAVAFVFLLNSRPVQLAARVVLTTIAFVAGVAQAVGVIRAVRAYEWGRWRRFAWMQYVALAVGLLIALLVPYMLLVSMYPELRSTPIKHT